jgi:hypothetical protein
MCGTLDAPAGFLLNVLGKILGCLVLGMNRGRNVAKPHPNHIGSPSLRTNDTQNKHSRNNACQFFHRLSSFFDLFNKKKLF